MTDIGLYRPDRERLGPAPAQGMADGGRFDRISRRRSGAVHFEEGQIFRSNARARIDRTQQGRLRRLARQRQSDRSAVGIDPRAEDHGADRVAIGERIIEGSQNHHRAALSPDIAVGAFVECKAPSAPGKHRGGAKPEIWVGGQQEVDAADNCGLDALAADCLARVMQGDERRRAGRIDRETRPTQIKYVGNAIGENTQGVAGHEIRVGTGRIAKP